MNTSERQMQLEAFYELSATLTGFPKIDLIGTGVGQEYLSFLVASAGEENVALLLDVSKNISKTETALRKFFDNPHFDPLVRNSVLMWYLGSWYQLPDWWHRDYLPDRKPVAERVVSASAYQEALWSVAIGAHPRGAKPPGFGSWQESPRIGGHDDEWIKNTKNCKGKR